jgi:hypothetical protein
MGYARSLLEAIPEDLRRQIRSPQSAESVLYALILSTSTSDTESLLDALNVSDQRQALVTLSETIRALGSRLRLPLIDLALPVLKPLPADNRARILSHLTALIEVDNRYTFFEWALVGLAHQQLGEQSGKNRRTRFRRYGALAAELQLLFSVLTWASGAENEEARTLFQRSTHGLLPAGRTLLPLTHCGSHKLGNAVDRLADLSPYSRDRSLMPPPTWCWPTARCKCRKPNCYEPSPPCSNARYPRCSPAEPRQSPLPLIAPNKRHRVWDGGRFYYAKH